MATDFRGPSEDFFPDLDRQQSREAIQLVSELDEFKGRPSILSRTATDAFPAR